MGVFRKLRVPGRLACWGWNQNIAASPLWEIHPHGRSQKRSLALHAPSWIVATLYASTPVRLNRNSLDPPCAVTKRSATK